MIFSKKEFELRYDRARELLQQKRLDVLFVTGEENFHYFTGGAGMTLYRSFSRPHVALIPLDGDPIVIASELSIPGLQDAGAVKDIRPFTSVQGIPAELLEAALQDVNLQYHCIGAELGLEQRLGMPYQDFRQFLTSFPAVKFVDASDIFWQLRMVKSSAEVNLIRNACEITGRARQRTFDELESGMTERQIARIFGKCMLQEGADRVGFVHICSKLPPNPTYLHFERAIESGDTIYLDGGAAVWAYTCDFPRLATVGPASSKQIKYHRILTEINQKMADALHPGLKCSDLYKIAIKLFKEVGGISDFPSKAGRMGHGQGMMVTEPPSISAGNDTVLKPGFTLSTEPGFGDGLHIWEDVHVITADGHEQLSTESEALREV